MSRHLFAAATVALTAGCSPAADQSGAPQAERTKAYDGIGAGETIRFTGTEPFWGGEAIGDRVLYSTPENIDGTAIHVKRFAGNNGLSFSGMLGQDKFDLAITPGSCSDGMSDRTYPFVATLRIGSEDRAGCAWTERQPYRERPEPTPIPSASPTASAPLIAERLVRIEWSKAENRETCRALAFSDDGGADGTPRRASFAGGWAVAFDQPDTRSAYGLAGAGIESSGRDAIRRQWPLFRELPALPPGSFAGYGLEGAGTYPPDKPGGEGLQSLAYVEVGGEKCLYNVWSKLGRAHLEILLDGLRTMPR